MLYLYVLYIFLPFTVNKVYYKGQSANSHVIFYRKTINSIANKLPNASPYSLHWLCVFLLLDFCFCFCNFSFQIVFHATIVYGEIIKLHVYTLCS